MTDLQRLIEAVDAGEGNRNDGSLYRLFGDDWTHAWDVLDRECLSAAVRFLRATLPGWDYSVHGNGQAALWPPGTIDEQNAGCIETEFEDQPARALFFAILRALAARTPASSAVDNSISADPVGKGE